MANIITISTSNGPASFLTGNLEAVQQTGPHQLRCCTKAGHSYCLSFNSAEETKEAGDALIGAMKDGNP